MVVSSAPLKVINRLLLSLLKLGMPIKVGAVPAVGAPEASPSGGV